MLFAAVLATVWLSEGRGSDATWTIVAEMTEARNAFGIAQLTDGVVLTAGGIDTTGTYCATASVYNKMQNQWTKVAPMSKIRYQFAMVQVKDGVVLAVGGDGNLTDDGNPQAPSTLTAELYDAKTDTWKTASSVPGNCRSLVYGLAPFGTQGQILGIFQDCGTGILAYLYNVETDTWTETTAPPKPIVSFNSHALASIGTSGVLGVADCCGNESNIEVHGDALLYSGNDANWTDAPSVNSFQSGFSLASLPNGNVTVLAGGMNGTSSQLNMIANVSMYDAKTNSWTPITPMHVPRLNPGLVAIDDCSFLACGGLGGPSNNVEDVTVAEMLTVC